MAKNVYEALFILDSNVYSRDAAGLSGQVNDTLTRHGAELLASRLWEERRLAYPIDGHKKGTYWLSYFRAESGNIPAMQRDFQINESVLRTLIIKIEPRLADAMVAHALGQAVPAAAAAGAGGGGSV